MIAKPSSRPASLFLPLRALCLAAALGAIPSHPLSAVAFEVQRVPLPTTFELTEMPTIEFASDVFVRAGVVPLVFVIPTTQGDHPCAIRFAEVRQTGFDVACVEPTGQNGPHFEMALHYIAIEPGVHSIPAFIGGTPTTLTFAAGATSTSAVQHGCSSDAVCGIQASAPVSFGTTFRSPPAVLLQIQSMNSETGTPPTTVSAPFLTATVVEDLSGDPIISTTGLELALERSQTQQGTVLEETVGWLAVEATTDCVVLDLSSLGGPSAVPFEALVTGEVIDGWGNGCNAGEGASFVAGCFANSPAVVATKRTRNGGDGGWIRRCTNGFSSDGVRFTIDEDTNSGAGNEGDDERNHVDEAASLLAFGIDFSTPVTLAFFASERTAGGVRFRWSTATEAGNLGFHLYEDREAGRHRITGRLIPSEGVSTIEPRSYEVEVSGVEGTSFWISDVDLRNHRRDHGPFRLGRSYGRVPEVLAIDWPAIRAEHRSKRATPDAGAGTASGSGLPFELHVSRSGLYRVTHEDLLEAGLDLTGAPVAAIALSAGGEPQPRRVEPHHPDATFGPGSFIEFYGRALSTSLYTRTNVYRLELSQERARPVRRNERSVPAAPGESSYMARLRRADNRQYSFASPIADPWFDRRILAFTEPVSEDLPLTVDHLAQGAEAAQLRVELWGGTDFPSPVDHRVTLAVNGHTVWESSFDGVRPVEAVAPLPPGLLREGANRLTVSLPGDTGVPFDLVHLEAYGLHYPRRFVARHDRLDFHAQGQAFAVQGFASSSIVAYRLSGPGEDQPTLMRTQVDGDGAGGYRVRLRGHPGAQRRYLVSSVGALLSPDLLVAARRPAPPTEPAELLIIAHRSFLDGVQELADARRRQGYTVGVVDVESLYALYSHGVVDPEAIRRFVAHAATDLGTRYVLLVGGDTYDPLDFSGVGSLSFIPTPYVQTDPLIRFTPADPLLADVDGDGFPDLPIGRLPVRTRGELATVIAKTLAFAEARPRRSSVFFADDAEPMTSFARVSDRLVATLPEGWTATRIYLDALDPGTARTTLLEALEEGPALASYVGHSGPSAWTSEGIFRAQDAAALGNPDPMVVTQWGCWNTYHVAPAYDTLGHRFLLADEQGAAAVLGAATLTTVASQGRLGALVQERIAEPGVPLGAALQEAKEELRHHGPELLDVLLGWTLLGDPTLVLSP